MMRFQECNHKGNEQLDFFSFFETKKKKRKETSNTNMFRVVLCQLFMPLIDVHTDRCINK